MTADDARWREVAVAVVVHQGRVLVQTRSEAGTFQGYWEFPGGGREPGETIEECARRECLEELGLGVRVLELLEHVEWCSPGRALRIHFLLCEAEEAEPRARALEGQSEVRWAPVPDLLELRLLPANASVVRRLQERFG